VTVNPDFVPWAHELIFHLADADSGARNVHPGEPIVLELNPIPPADVATLSVTTPGGLQGPSHRRDRQRSATVTRNDGRALAQLDDTNEPGLYQILLPRPPGGSAFATVAADARESDLRFLEPAETTALARDWPLSFEAEPDRLAGRLFAAGRGGRHEIWQYLVLATIAGLCAEIWLTRQLVKSRGIAELNDSTGLSGAERMLGFRFSVFGFRQILSRSIVRSENRITENRKPKTGCRQDARFSVFGKYFRGRSSGPKTESPKTENRMPTGATPDEFRPGRGAPPCAGRRRESRDLDRGGGRRAVALVGLVSL